MVGETFGKDLAGISHPLVGGLATSFHSKFRAWPRNPTDSHAFPGGIYGILAVRRPAIYIYTGFNIIISGDTYVRLSGNAWFP